MVQDKDLFELPIFTRRQMADLLQCRQIRLKKRLGQNFLADLNLLKLIVRESQVQPQDFVVEVGTGLGNLTSLLAEKAAQVLTIEYDPALHKLSCELLSDYTNIIFWQGDVLAQKKRLANWTEWVPHKTPVRLVANLPYQVASPFLVLFFQQPWLLQPSVVLVQKEVGEKLAAKPCDSHYGRLSIIIQALTKVEILRQVPPQVFYPPPKVESLLMRIVPKSRLSPEEAKVLDQILHVAFSQRRKKLGKTFRDFPQLLALWENVGVSLEKRPQEIEVKHWMEIAKGCLLFSADVTFFLQKKG